MKERAKQLADLGWFVFPCNGKKPLWKWRDRSTIDKDIIAENFPEHANIAVDCGKSGLVVFDLDVHNEMDGLGDWEALKQELGFDDEGACITGTPTGGRHIIFADRTGGRIGNSDKMLPDSIDVRGNGGYIVAPPSKNGAGKYTWIEKNFPPAPVPSQLVNLLLPEPKPTSQEVHLSSNGKGRYGEVALRDEVDQLARTAPGSRNDALNRSAFNLGQLVGARVLDRHSVETALYTASRSNGLIQDDGQSSVEATMESGLSAGEAQPRQIPELAVGSKLHASPAKTDFLKLYKANKFLRHTDQGNGERMIALFGRYLRYCKPLNKWFVWDGKRWSGNDLLQVERMAKETARSIWHEVALCVDDEEREAKRSWARRSESHARRKAAIASARSEPGVPILPEELDAHQWLLNVANGTIDLRTGELLPHNPEDLITKITDVAYSPKAECPNWLGFLEYFLDGDQEMIDYLQRAVGLSLTGLVRKAIFIMSGTGDNGKSTFVEAISGVLGEYALKTPTSTLITQKYSSIPNDVARMKGARFIYASELDRGMRLSEAFIKAWTGNTKVTARFMRAEFFEFMPEGKLWLDTNHKPEVKGTDNAIWNRLKLIDFNVVIPKEEQDPDFGRVLEQEYEGILAWAVEGCLQWQEQGLDEPKQVTDATASYRAEMDQVQAFIDECCVANPLATVPKADFHAEYVNWGGKESQRSLSKLMQEHGYESTRLHGGVRAWKGVGLLTSEEASG